MHRVLPNHKHIVEFLGFSVFSGLDRLHSFRSFRSADGMNSCRGTGDVGPSRRTGQDVDGRVAAGQQRGHGPGEAGMAEDHNALGPPAQLRARRCAQELGVAHEGLGTAARPGGGLGQERPVQVLGERAARSDGSMIAITAS